MSVENSAFPSITQAVLSQITKDATSETAAEFLIDVSTNYSSFLRPDDHKSIQLLLRSRWAEMLIERLKSGDFASECSQFGRVLLAYADAVIHHLVEDPKSDWSQHLMKMLHDLLRCEAPTAVDDEICVFALEFWSSYVEFISYNYDTGSENAPKQHDEWRSHVEQVVQDCWVKIRLPNLQIQATWDKDTRQVFKEFRKDVADLLQSSVTLFSESLLGRFIDMALVYLRNSRWEDFEATLFCINALSEGVADSPTGTSQLKKLLGSPEFASLLNLHTGVPEIVRKALVDTMGRFVMFYEVHTNCLLDSLRFLFECLEEPDLVVEASKSISHICASCRRSLVPQLDSFMVQCQRFLLTSRAETMMKSRVLGAIASIIQALQPEENKPRHLQSLLDFITRDVLACLTHLATKQLLEAEEAGVSALQCLASVGKGIQIPDDEPIDLESVSSTFWHQGEGAMVQGRIIEIIARIYEALPQSGAVIEAACGVFKTGFAEWGPGPFVFPAKVATEFILKSQIDTPRLWSILSTACALISSPAKSTSSPNDNEARALLLHVASFMQLLGSKLQASCAIVRDGLAMS